MKRPRQYIKDCKHACIKRKVKRKIKFDAGIYLHHVLKELRKTNRHMFSLKKNSKTKHSVMCRYILLYKLKGFKKTTSFESQTCIHITVHK